MGPVGIGVYSYKDIPAFGLTNPRSAAWHPSGSYALILNYTDALYRLDPATNALTKVGSAGASVYWRAIHFTPDGSKAILLGNVLNSPVMGRIYLWDDATSMLTEMASEEFAGGSYEAIAWSPDGTTCRILGSKSNGGGYIAYLWLFDPATGRSGVAAHATSAGCSDLAFATDGFGLPAVAVTCGVNGVSLFYLDAGGGFQDDVAAGSAGNVSTIAARPQGDYALMIGWTGPRLYRFKQGNWETSFNDPSFPNGVFEVQFSSDGNRALIVGRYGNAGGQAVGQLFEYRHNLYDQADITDVSIPNFDSPPYNADSSVGLNDAVWRPGCDGGLIVGGYDTFAGTKAYVIRFSVDNGVACPN